MKIIISIRLLLPQHSLMGSAEYGQHWHKSFASEGVRLDGWIVSWEHCKVRGHILSGPHCNPESRTSMSS